MRMLPRLEAEEAVAASNVAAMGSGILEKNDAAVIAKGWQDAIAGGAAPRKADPGRLMAKGFAVRKVVTDRARAKKAKA